LAQDDLPANVRQTQERILEALEGELEEKRTSELERKYAQKYKMVKFFGVCLFTLRAMRS
jgi:hypothetical protein